MLEHTFVAHFVKNDEDLLMIVCNIANTDRAAHLRNGEVLGFDPGHDPLDVTPWDSETEIELVPVDDEHTGGLKRNRSSSSLEADDESLTMSGTAEDATSPTGGAQSSAAAAAAGGAGGTLVLPAPIPVTTAPVAAPAAGAMSPMELATFTSVQQALSELAKMFAELDIDDAMNRLQKGLDVASSVVVGTQQYDGFKCQYVLLRYKAKQGSFDGVMQSFDKLMGFLGV